MVWSAVGGADIYRGQAAPATVGLHGHDEFFADFAKQVLPVPASIPGSVRTLIVSSI